MTEYSARIVISDSDTWASGISSLWEGLHAYRDEIPSTFALALCPERSNAILLGSPASIDLELLQKSVGQEAGGVGQSMKVDQGIFRAQRPLGAEQLAAIRDDFRLSMFGNLACLMENYAVEGLSRLLPVAETFLLLDRIDWADGHRIWPLSLKGQLWAFKRIGSNRKQKVYRAGERLLPALVNLEREGRIFDHSQALSETLSARVEILQRTYSRIHDYVSTISPADREKMSEQAAQMLQTVLAATHTAEEARKIAMHPNHMAYRIFMSMIYDLAPLIAIPTSHRLITFYAVTELLRKEYPELLLAATESGNQLGHTNA